MHHIYACSDDEHDDNDDDKDDEDDEDDDEAVQEGQLTETMPQFLETGRRLQQRSKSVHCLALTLSCITVSVTVMHLHYCFALQYCFGTG